MLSLAISYCTDIVYYKVLQESSVCIVEYNIVSTWHFVLE